MTGWLDKTRHLKTAWALGIHDQTMCLLIEKIIGRFISNENVGCSIIAFLELIFSLFVTPRHVPIFKFYVAISFIYLFIYLLLLVLLRKKVPTSNPPKKHIQYSGGCV